MRVGWYWPKLPCTARPLSIVISQFITWLMPSMTEPCTWFTAPVGLMIWRPMSHATQTFSTLILLFASTRTCATSAK